MTSSEAVSEWITEARCRHLPPSLFDPPGGTDEAREACAGCPVRDPCRQYLLRWPEQVGYGGGLTERERYLHRNREHRSRRSLANRFDAHKGHPSAPA